MALKAVSVLSFDILKTMLSFQSEGCFVTLWLLLAFYLLIHETFFTFSLSTVFNSQLSTAEVARAEALAYSTI
jgi:hypothetical protein